MTIKTFNKNSMGQNNYLCWCEKSGEGVLIDAGCSGLDEKAIMAAVNAHNITVKGILLTHGHYDHITAVDSIKSLTGAEVYSHVSEKQILADPNFNLSCRTAKDIVVVPDKFFNDSDIFEFGECALKVIHTPGHTPGGVCYYSAENEALFAGDTLFKGSVGRADLPMGDFAKLKRNITAKLLSLPEETIVYAGHGETTTIGREKKFNPYV